MRLWVEIGKLALKESLTCVSLLVRLWVEIPKPWVGLKPYPRQPPCEAVSWNDKRLSERLRFLRQPPCEAVSWNMTQGQISEDNTVSLLVRLWVEIPCFTKPNNDGLCQPPCEAVSWNKSESSYKISLPCQPPCEAVSWNIIDISSRWIQFVSLLVRLWVEIQLLLLSNPLPVRQPPWVLRCLFGYAIIDTILVSLFERLWIEKRNTLWLLYLREN